MTQPDLYVLRLLRSQSHLLTHEIGLMPSNAVLWKPAETEWSVQETLTHIRDIERLVFRWRVAQTAQMDTPPLPFFDEGAYHQEHWNPTEPIQTILADFVTDRAAEVVVLETADWSRAGVHPTRGPLTLDWQANYIVNHTWEHLSQIMRVRLNHATAVGGR
jgi:hypothetical protein